MVFVSESRAENIPTDTILSRLYDQAASLMEEGEYDSAQVCFNRAFATEGGHRITRLPDSAQRTGYVVLLCRRTETFAGDEEKRASLPARSGGFGKACQCVQRLGGALSPL